MTEFITFGQTIALVVMTGMLVSIVLLYIRRESKKEKEKEGSENGV